MSKSPKSTTKKSADVSICATQKPSMASNEPGKDQANEDIKNLTQGVTKIFWRHTREFVEAINTAANKPQDSWIQFQTYRTYYYGIMASTVSFTNLKTGAEWICVKVGFTQLEDITTRPSQVRSQIIRQFVGSEAEECDLELVRQCVRIIFCVPQSPLDPKLPIDVERAVRLAVGKSLPKQQAKDLQLPVSTEWVITNIGHLKNIVEICRKPDADSSHLTKLDQYKGAVPSDFRLEKVSKMIPEDVIPTLFK